MPEKSLRMEFGTQSGKTTTMTISNAKQSLDETTTKAAMQDMVASSAFATSKGDPYTSVIGASYIESIETVIFDTAAANAMRAALQTNGVYAE